MNDRTERDAVLAWLTGPVGWDLKSTERASKGRTVYKFYEADSGGVYIVHKMRAADLRWRHVRYIGFSHIKDLREAADRLWADYVAALEEDSHD